MRNAHLAQIRRSSLTRWITSSLLAILASHPIAAQTVSPLADDTAEPISDTVRQIHTMHVSPHLVVFDPTTRTTTLTFSNTGTTPLEAEILVQLGYTWWQSTDTLLFSRHWATEAPTEDPHDTVIATPGPKDHYAGRWLSGVPTHLQLAPHETRRVTLRITPPPGIPNGEYYARLVTLAHAPQSKGKSHDTRKQYALPVHRAGPPPLRDSVRIFYRQGPQSMRLRLTGVAQLDTTQEGNDSAAALGLGERPLRHLVRVHLMGPTHFEGYESDYYVTPSGQRIPLVDERAKTVVAFTIHHDAVLRDLDQTNMLTSGHYTFVVRLIPLQSEFSPAQRVPADTAKVEIPFDIP